MSAFEFAVVTKIPDPGSDDSNLRSGMTDIFVKVGVEVREHPRYERSVVKLLPDVVGAGESLNYMLETFHVGEILIVDQYGREVGFPGRKPGKWGVTCEHFTDLDAAVDCARRHTGNWRYGDVPDAI